MPFSPAQFEGKGLSSLVRELARLDAGEVVAGLVRHARSPRAPFAGGMLPPTIEWRPSWFPTVDAAETLPDPSHPPVTASDVELGDYLGGGRQGAVYRGRVRSTGLVVAVKAIYGGEAAAGGQAAREARVGAKLSHPNVLRVFEARRAGEFWVVVMEYLQGEDLARSGLPAAEVESLAAALSSAVVGMARARVVHRDIKPANIIRRSADGAPVLVDFGLAVDLDALAEPPGFAGTPLFMAPEAFSDPWPDPSWDAYSVAVTIASLLANDRLPGSSGLPDLMRKKASGAFDRDVARLLGEVAGDDLRDWCRGLLGASSSRLPLVERASLWRA